MKRVLLSPFHYNFRRLANNHPRLGSRNFPSPSNGSPKSTSYSPNLKLVSSCRYNSSQSSSSNNNDNQRPDPLARRPNKKCDPYGQGGKPLSQEDAERLLLTVHNDWIIVEKEEETAKNDDDDKNSIILSIQREFIHPDFMSGSRFVTHMAAVAQMNDHFPSLLLERRLDSRAKAWRVVTTVTCHTKVLQGLSHHDFFLATLMDVEIERPEVSSLILPAIQNKR